MKQIKEIIFPDLDHRRIWMTNHLPDRRGTDCPGVYEIPTGWVAVQFGRLVFTTKEELRDD